MNGVDEVVNIELSVSEINTIIDVLGNQPSKTGLYPLMVKLSQLGQLGLQKKQKEHQEKEQPVAVAEDEEDKN